MSDLGRRTDHDDKLTVIAAGMLAATLAAICHETIGHGIGCRVAGGHIALLTSIWFRCRGAGILTDAGGPLASLIAGLAAFAFLSHSRAGGVPRLVLLLLGAISVFWFAAQLIDHAIVNRDDWAIIARRNHWPALWRPISIALGIAVYAGGIALTTAALRRKGGPGRPAVVLAYAAGAASAVVAGLMWQPMPLRSALEGFLTLGIAPLGLLIAARRAHRDTVDAAPIPRAWGWIAVSAATFIVFLLLQARGIGPLAGYGLPH
ncbi:MAG TPA: hypothetical protein VE224_02260 [Pseudolabrys sp.]|nr:hypothetical protein [Pseudolabrys sp.]